MPTIALPPLRLVAVKVITQPSRSLIERWMNTATKDRYKHLLERIEDPDQDVDYEDFLSCLVDEHGNLRRLSRLDDEQFRFALDKLSDRKQRDRAARSRSLSPTSSTRSSLHPTPSIISRPSSPEDAMSINQANMPSDLVLLASGNQPILDDAGCPVHNRHGIFSSGNASEFSHLFPSVCEVLSSGGVDEAPELEGQYFGALAPPSVVISSASPVHHPCSAEERANGAQESCSRERPCTRPVRSCNSGPLRDAPGLYDTPEDSEPDSDCESSESCCSSPSALNTFREGLALVPDVVGKPGEEGKSSFFIHENAAFCYKLQGHMSE